MDVGRNPVHDVPPGVLIVCGLLGGVIGTAASGVLESDSAQRWGGVPTVLVGVIEESVKVLVPNNMGTRANQERMTSHVPAVAAVGTSAAWTTTKDPASRPRTSEGSVRERCRGHAATAHRPGWRR
jgi:hypothetical protein